jgi:hypothetical protein
MEFKDWKGCKKMCQSYSLSLLKIDDYDEKVSWSLTFTFILGFCLSLWDNKITEDIHTVLKKEMINFLCLCVFVSYVNNVFMSLLGDSCLLEGAQSQTFWIKSFSESAC